MFVKAAESGRVRGSYLIGGVILAWLVYAVFVMNRSADRSLAIQCDNNLHQLRRSLTIAYTTSAPSVFPTAYQSLTDVPETVKMCPETKSPYAYNPQTGQIYCTTPGHPGAETAFPLNTR
jgi:hypothetical protein